MPVLFSTPVTMGKQISIAKTESGLMSPDECKAKDNKIQMIQRQQQQQQQQNQLQQSTPMYLDHKQQQQRTNLFITPSLMSIEGKPLLFKDICHRGIMILNHLFAN